MERPDFSTEFDAIAAGLDKIYADAISIATRTNTDGIKVIPLDFLIPMPAGYPECRAISYTTVKVTPFRYPSIESISPLTPEPSRAGMLLKEAAISMALLFAVCFAGGAGASLGRSTFSDQDPAP